MNQEINFRFLWRISLVATLGGFLFGYDTAVISGAIRSVRWFFDLDDLQEGWAVSSALVGCVFGALMASFLSQYAGRKKSLVLAALLFLISAIGSALSFDFASFVGFRIIGGLGVGLASMLSPMYISEISPAQVRGKMVSMYQFAIVTGIALVFFVNYFIEKGGNTEWNLEFGWRWMLGSEVLPAALFVLMLFWIPESPRWLSMKKRETDSESILSLINGQQRAAEIQLEINKSLKQEKASWADLLQPAVILALGVGIGLSVFQQITGINAIMYYAPKIFETFGTSRDSALFQNALIGVVNLSFTLIAIKTIDRLGRKQLLLLGIKGMTLSLLAFGTLIYFGYQGIWLLPIILLYVAAFAMSWGPVVWVMLSEIFNNKVRSLAMSIAVFVQWGFNIVVSQSFPVLVGSTYLNRHFNGAFPFLLFGLMAALAWWFVKARVPETKNKTLEEMEAMWKGRLKNK